LARVYSALIIDADGKTPATIKNILAPFGFEFTITENGPEAVNVARQAAPDIIFLRAELPLTSGFSVCNRLRRHEDTKKIPLIMYSSNVSEDVFEQHRNLKTHADDYLRLPLETERLLTAIRPVLPIQDKAPPPAPEKSAPSRAARGKGLEIEVSDAPPPPPPRAEPRQQFDQEFNAGFREMQSEPSAATPAAAARREGSAPHGDSESSDGGAFKAQREVLNLKAQLNAKSRELLSLRDDLEVRERTILDAKKHHRELQAQIGELESQMLAAQEQILSSREATESATRDKQTALKREEGTKTRLEATQKKLKEVEGELNTARTQAAQERDRLNAALHDANQRIETQSSLINDLESDRDGLGAQLTEAREQIARLIDGFEGARRTIATLEQQITDLRAQAEQDLADARDERTGAIEALSRQHQGEIDEREAEHAAAIKALRDQLAEARDQAAQERERMSAVLMETEENARLQITQITQTLAATEETARREIQQLQTTLAQTEETARGELAALQSQLADHKAQAEEAAAEAARRISALEHEVDELGGHLDRTEATLSRRRDAERRAQQALAVALKLLEEDEQP
jgi:DNA-binding response OmpR family regulator/predicted  nucleic acid-binding Zn-ribbon protein